MSGDWPWMLKIRTFGHFEICMDDEPPVAFSGKVQKKPLELLKALIAFGGENISEMRLAEALWPDTDGDLALSSFNTTLYRLRKLLNNDRILTLKGNELSLDPRYCWIDAKAFERLCGEIDILAKGLTRREQHPALEDLFERAMALYRGHFLPVDMDQPWATWMREYLRNRFLRMLMKAGNYWEERKLWEKATEWYWRGLHMDHLAEQIYQRLMVCYQEQGQGTEAVRIYQRCRLILAANLDLVPSETTEKIYRSILPK